MKLLTVQLSPSSYDFPCIRYMYSPQHTDLKDPLSLCPSIMVRDQVPHSNKTKGKKL